MEIVEISISSEYFAKAMSIYQSSFPESERHLLEIITKRIHIGKEVLFGLINDSHELLGIIMLWDLGFKSYKVLDYFAIDERYRSMHYGEMFLAETIKLSISNGEVLVLEIETPYNKSQDTLEYKRLKFYRKSTYAILLFSILIAIKVRVYIIQLFNSTLRNNIIPIVSVNISW